MNEATREIYITILDRMENMVTTLEVIEIICALQDILDK